MNGAPTGRGDKRRRSRASAVLPLALVGSLAATLIGALAPTQATAQASARPGITVAANISAEPASETAFGIRVGPADAVPRNSFLRVRGLPPMAALSEGHSIAPGTWAVSLAALPDLRIMLPAGAAGRSEIVITLVAVDGSVLAEAKATLAIAAARQLERGQPRREATGPPSTATILRAGAPLQPPPEATDPPRGPAPPPAITPQDRERAQRLMKKGDAQLDEGNVSAARLLYERAAEAGLAQAAMALAATFDPAEFARLKLRGIDADPKEARRWYERARQLGAADADERLRRIGGR